MYVLLTGAISNAGDFLIKEKAIELLKFFKPKRKIITFDRWKTLTEEQIKIINNSRLLILCGGPAFQYNLYPGIYPLTKDLKQIKVPIITFGLGWKGMPGNWQDTHKYLFTVKSYDLLNRIETSGFKSSLRDYLTLNMLKYKGFNNFIMTGCPSWYNLNSIGQPLTIPSQIKKVAFSVGVSFIKNKQFFKSLVELILKLKDYFGESLVCTFHHPVDCKYYSRINLNKSFYNAHRELIDVLEGKGIKWVDLSFQTSKLTHFYDKVDFHVGFRVHAHLYMLSVRKPSILLIEDGRGYGVFYSLGGLCLGAIERKNNLLYRALNKYRILSSCKLKQELSEDLINNITYEIENGFPRERHIPNIIDEHYEIMKKFISQLP